MRFFNVPQQHSARQSRGPSRTNSIESFVPEIHQILEDLEGEDILEEFASEDGDFPDSEDFLLMMESYMSEDLTFQPLKVATSLSTENNMKTSKTILQKNDHKTDSLNQLGSINSLNSSTAKLRASYFFDEKFTKALKRSNLTISGVSPPISSKKSSSSTIFLAYNSLYPNQQAFKCSLTSGGICNASSLDFDFMKPLSSYSINDSISNSNDTQFFDLSNTAPATPTKWASSKASIFTESHSDNKSSFLYPTENFNVNNDSKKNLQLLKMEKLKSFPAYFNFFSQNVTASSSLTAWRVFNTNKVRRLQQPPYRRFLYIKLLLCLLIILKVIF